MASEEPKEHPIANNDSLANGTVTDLNISFQDHHESSNDVVRHYSVHNRRNSLEIKEELSEKEMKALAELRERVANELGPDHQVTNHKLLKFIVARKYDIDAALQQYVRMAQWRKKNHIDNWEKFGVEHLRKLVPESFHGFDKHGWPSYIVKAGKVNPAQVKRITVKDFILIHVWGNEISFNRAEDEGRKRGKYVDKFSNIVDMEGLSLKHRKLMGYLKAVAKVDEKYYPECLGHTFIVNAPWVFTGLWSLFKSWLDPVTVSKIDVLGSDYKEVLLKHYEPSQLPVEYGGTCVCDGGCVKVFSEEEIEAALSAHEAKLKLTTVTVKAGNTFSTVHEIGKFGASVSYYFRTDDADIKFGITFTPDDAKDQPVTVITADKVRSHRTPDKESFDLYKGGKMQLTWDNTYSYWKDKTLHYLVAIEEHEDHMEPDPDEVFPLPRQ